MTTERSLSIRTFSRQRRRINSRGFCSRVFGSIMTRFPRTPRARHSSDGRQIRAPRSTSVTTIISITADFRRLPDNTNPGSNATAELFSSGHRIYFGRVFRTCFLLNDCGRSVFDTPAALFSRRKVLKQAKLSSLWKKYLKRLK